MDLILGAGSTKTKIFFKKGDDENYKEDTITLDINKDHNPDVVWDLNKLPLPFKDNMFDEIHAYHVIEHLGTQGDYESFFNFFNEIYRIIKHDGLFFAVTPHWNNEWAFGDPGHTRIINHGTVIFLDQSKYEEQVGKTSMTDYRFIYKGDFKIILSSYTGGKEGAENAYQFILKANKET